MGFTPVGNPLEAREDTQTLHSQCLYRHIGSIFKPWREPHYDVRINQPHPTSELDETELDAPGTAFELGLIMQQSCKKQGIHLEAIPDETHPDGRIPMLAKDDRYYKFTFRVTGAVRRRFPGADQKEDVSDDLNCVHWALRCLFKAYTTPVCVCCSSPYASGSLLTYLLS